MGQGRFDLDHGAIPCGCNHGHRSPQLIVVTGGPGAGKTALLEKARRVACKRVVVLPEVASIVFGGGFPRLQENAARRCSQRAIFHVQQEMEEMVVGQSDIALALCDRGTLDGLAYWPGAPQDYWEQLGTTREAQLERYAGVIHLEVPPPEYGYANTALRIESAQEAARIDDAIGRAWAGHPNMTRVRSEADFLKKIEAATDALQGMASGCCEAQFRVGTAR